MDFLKDLNKTQLEAVTYNDGPSLVIAGAGSGKTRVLTYKIAYLLSLNIHPTSILALTFTNKAAREMRSRIADLVGHNVSKHLWMGTFHSIFSRILRNEAEKIGYSKDFSIYDTNDSNSLIKDIVKDLNLDIKTYKPSFVHSRISAAKNNLISAQEYYSNADTYKYDSQSNIPRTNEIYAIYANRCKLANAMDFDDLLMQTNILFRDFPEVLLKYQNLFKYILVDEYQDTNFSQYLIIKNLAELHQRICVVGDDAQSIYSFRGANIDNILKFQQNYSNSKLFKLEQNYRSTQNIVNAANSLISKNSEQIEKTIFSENNEGEPIIVTSVMTDIEESINVANNIKQLFKFKDISYDEFAVLYRTNSQSRTLEEALRKENIPYRIYGGVSFYQRKEIKDMIAYFRLTINHNDDEALKRVINYPTRGIGAVTIDKIIKSAQENGVSMWKIIDKHIEYKLDINAGTATRLAKFTTMIDSFSKQLYTLDAHDLAKTIITKTGILDDTIQDKSAESLSKIDNIQELLNAIYEFSKRSDENLEFVSLAEFLSEVYLLTDQDSNENEMDEKVTLMTVHAAKGLEFRVIFIVGMEEQLFPSPYAFTPREMEEERRLFYVAITRAKERCFISHSKSRYRNGQTNFANPSRFLRDINPQYVQNEELFSNFGTQNNLFGQNKFIQRNRFNDNFENPATQTKKLSKIKETDSEITHYSNEKLPVNAFVKHNVFGIGKVLETTIENGNEKAKVDFGEKGVKSLLLKFAKLEILK